MGKAIDELKSVVMSSGGTILRHEIVWQNQARIRHDRSRDLSYTTL